MILTIHRNHGKKAGENFFPKWKVGESCKVSNIRFVCNFI